MNKKLLISLLVILLTGWIAGSCFFYICKIRKNCGSELVNIDVNEFDNNFPTLNKEERSIIEKPTFSISDENILISRSSVNTSFEKGTSKLEVPDSMIDGLNQLATYLKNNPDKKLKITGFSLSSNNNESLGIDRANSMISYIKSHQDIPTDRFIAESSTSDGFYLDNETNRIIGGLEYEIIKQNYISIKDSTTEIDQTDYSIHYEFDKSLQRRVSGKRTLYYPLTYFEVEPTYELEKYFENLKTYFEQNPEGLVQITGHTDGHNEELSEGHQSKIYAETVKTYLVSEFEMNPRNFRVAGRGNSKPASKSNTLMAKAKNRRIEFTLIK